MRHRRAGSRQSAKTCQFKSSLTVSVDHFCLVMGAASIDDLVAHLRQRRIDIVKGPVERRDGRSVFVHDPDGVRVELRLPS